MFRWCVSLCIPGPLPVVTESGADVKPKEEKELGDDDSTFSYVQPQRLGMLQMYEDQEKVEPEYKWTFFDRQLYSMISQLPPQKRANISFNVRRHLTNEDDKKKILKKNKSQDKVLA